MKSLLIAGCSLFLGFASAFAANITSPGVQGDNGGLLTIDGTDDYWWFCAQPDSSRGPLQAGPGGYNGSIVSLDYGWTHQTTERFSYVTSAPAEVQADIAQHPNVIEYILDQYLPWADTDNRFLENSGLTDQEADNDFLNRLYAIHAYTKTLFQKSYDDTNPLGAGFVELQDFTPVNPWDTLDAQPGQVLTAAEVARQAFFDQIRDQVKAIASGFGFDTYEPVDGHQYLMVNTYETQGTALDWQDAIFIGAVPEPSTGLLALGSVLLLGTRRRRA